LYRDALAKLNRPCELLDIRNLQPACSFLELVKRSRPNVLKVSSFGCLQKRYSRMSARCR